jgi:imidazole glycerol-phosphate synthase subunit HisH
MSKVVIIDYQLGNLFSVRQALQNIGLDVTVSTDPEELKNADAAVLPGVGAFGDAMNNLKQQGLVEGIHEHIEKGKPFMGVCLGLQLLFAESEEFGSSKGLGLLPGVVKRFSNHNEEGNTVRVPQIAWNEIYKSGIDWEKTPLKSLDQNEHMYFVHSFYVEPSDHSCVLSLTQYHNKEYTSAVLKDNIFACQFHPEKSAEKGLGIYRNWAQQNGLI